MFLPSHPPFLQSTFPNKEPCQDEINLLLTEQKLNYINFSTVLESGDGLWEWFQKVCGKILLYFLSRDTVTHTDL